MTVLKFSFIALLALPPFAIAQNPKVGINNSAQEYFALAISSGDFADRSTLVVSAAANTSGDCL